MKNYFYLCVLKSLFITLLCALTVKSYAINFDEPRRVIIPQYANAVYRDLTVLDKMYLDVAEGEDRVFLLELGKRPTYFWNKNQMLYLYQTQQLNLGGIIYNGDPTINKNIFTVANISLKNGSFASEGLFFGSDSIIQINRDSNLLVNYKDEFPVNLVLAEHIITYDIFARSFGYVPEVITYNTRSPSVEYMYLRDVKFNEVYFPSPRLMVYDRGSFYQARGTALNFNLANVNSIRKAPKSYYGPWELWGPSNQKGVLYPSNSGSDPCGDTPDRCYKVSVSCGRGIDPGPGCTQSQPDYDTNDSIFRCEDKPFDGSASGTYDHPILHCKDYCYDYQVVNIAPKGYDLNSPENYNGNMAYFEFKVEEIFQVENTSSGRVAHLISQRPKTRVSTNNLGENEKLLAISTMTAAGWKIVERDPALQRFYIDNKKYTVLGDPKYLTYSDDDNPCFTSFEGKLGSDNYVYIRTVEDRELKGGVASGDSLWPEQEGKKQDLVIRTYRLGFCPKKREDYADYENNYSSDGDLIEAMLIKQNGNWTNAKVCVRRKVKCNSLSGDARFARKYQPLSTDY